MPSAENFRGTSALPYHLLIHRPKHVEVTLFTYNVNEVPLEQVEDIRRKLKIDIHFLQVPKWFKYVFKYHLLWCRVFLKFPLHHYIHLPKSVVDMIHEMQDLDGIWVYGEEHSTIVNQFPEYKRVHTMPDSEALFYYRMLGKNFVVGSYHRYWRYVFMYPKFRRMESNFNKDPSIVYHLVGEADRRFLVDSNPKLDARFIHHPHYDLSGQQCERKFHTPIRLLVAGQNNFYMQPDGDELVNRLVQSAEELRGEYELTFLGKGWEQAVERLQTVGWTIRHISFAPDYIEEIQKHDIQITPISIGTGTKGKVLDALANGLLVIGSDYALENIAVNDGSSCIQYIQVEDVPSILSDILKNKPHYEQMAKNGKQTVLSAHSRTTVSLQLFSVFGEISTCSDK